MSVSAPSQKAAEQRRAGGNSGYGADGFSGTGPLVRLGLSGAGGLGSAAVRAEVGGVVNGDTAVLTVCHK